MDERTNVFLERMRFLRNLVIQFKVFFRFVKQKSPKYAENICYTSIITKLFIYLNPLPSNEIVTKKWNAAMHSTFFVILRYMF